MLFEKTQMLSKFSQSSNINIAQAVEICDLTIMDLTNVKNNYNEIYEKNSRKSCNGENIVIANINVNISRNAKKRRLNENNETRCLIIFIILIIFARYLRHLAKIIKHNSIKSLIFIYLN